MDNGTKIAIGAIFSVLLLLGGYYGYSEGWFTKDDGGDTANVPQQPINVIVQNPTQTVTNPTQPVNNPVQAAGAVPVEQLNAIAKNKFTQASVTTGNFSVYVPGSDVSDPYVQPLDRIGAGSSSTALIIQTETAYDLYFNAEGATNYDDKLTNYNINYNPETGKGFLMLGGKSFHAVSPVGTFVDVDSLPSVQTGVNSSYATDGIAYDESALAGSMWIRVDIGNNNANTELRQVVQCFRDADGDMDGNEVTAISAAYVSGSTAISIPGNLQTYWEDSMGGAGAGCVQIANLLGSSQKARWEFTFTVDESEWDAGEEFEMTWDDLGDYLKKQYPSRNAKATAETLTINNQA